VTIGREGKGLTEYLSYHCDYKLYDEDLTGRGVYWDRFFDEESGNGEQACMEQGARLG